FLPIIASVAAKLIPSIVCRITKKC
uniref:Brevinin-1SPc n=1 Tax=Lithobates septentrionalis TaxID=190274 RepID=BR1C_LITST|nr:RecName: Full=Brevinin-1SPc [Lithobates septentrionalis]